MTLSVYDSMNDSLILFSSDDESESHYETKQYSNFSEMLKGVPPPSSITISKFSVEEMLQKYKENCVNYGFGNKSTDNDFLLKKNNPVPFLKYLNSSQISESIAALLQKVQNRYVQLETMSSCNIWFNDTLQSCSSAKKRLRLRQGAGISPGRRLSHLARRRQFFSSANLQRLANTDNIRQIEIRKNDNSRGERKKINRTIEYEKLNSSKRALFLSPENGTPTKYGTRNMVNVEKQIYSSDSDEKKIVPLQEKSKKAEVLRWLSQQNFENGFPKKRLRDECASHLKDRKRKCPRRSLNFSDEDVSKSYSSVTSDSSNVPEKKTSLSLGKLTQNHKNKLLWAVSVILKENNITRNDENFKSCAATLFHTCRKNLDEILSIQTASGTSEKILQYARKEIPKILADLGINNRLSNTVASMVKRNDETVKMREDSKENVNRTNVGNFNLTLLESTKIDAEFVFKTPKKVSSKRIVKSCQKSNCVVKKRVIRRWHSLESIITNYTETLSKNVFGKSGEICTQNNSVRLPDSEKSENNEVHNLNIDAHCSIEISKTPQATDLPLRQIKNEENTLAISYDSYEFSPIPSSVQEEYDSPDMYPALCMKHNNAEDESEVISGVNSISPESDSSFEVSNQDREMELLLSKEKVSLQARSDKDAYNKDTFSDEKGDKREIYQSLKKIHQEDYESSVTIDFNRVSEKLTKDGEMDPAGELLGENIFSEVNGFTCTLQSSIIPECGRKEPVKSADTLKLPVGYNEIDKEGQSQNIPVENAVQCNTSLVSHSDEVNRFDLENNIEVATYKPKKLVVKKSKPNWKLVKKDESDLILKMRLSHEWEIIRSNSSRSEMENNSECDRTSLNCSQNTQTNDDGDTGSEAETEDSSQLYSDDLSFGEEDKEKVIKKPNVAIYSNDSSEESSFPCLNLNGNYKNSNEKESNKDAKGYNLDDNEYETGTISLSEDCKKYVNWRNFNESYSDSFLSDVGSMPNNKELVREKVGCSNQEKVEEKMVCEENMSDFSVESDLGIVEENNKNNDRSVLVLIKSPQSRDRNKASLHSTNYVSSHESQSFEKINGRNESFDYDSVTVCEQEYTGNNTSYDSLSGNSWSSSSSPNERRKRLLSLENYKSQTLKLETENSSEHLEKIIGASDEKTIGNSHTNKNYNITLKHPNEQYKRTNEEKYKSRSRNKSKCKERDKNNYLPNHEIVLM